MAEKKKRPGRVKGSVYTLKQKMEALALLNKQKNLLQTAKDLCISPGTLRGWRDKYGDHMEKVLYDNPVSVEVIEAAEDRNESLIKKVYDVKDLIVDRLKELIPKESDIDKITRTLKTLSEIDGTIKAGGGSEEDRRPITNVYQLVNQRLTSIGDGKATSNNPLEGNTEK